MTYEEMREKLNQRVYEKNQGQGFFEDLVELHNLDPNDPLTSRMYSKAWEDGHSAGYHDIFTNFNDLVQVFKGD